MAAATGGVGGEIAFMGLLESCLTDAQQILAYARTPDGAVRNAKLILMGSNHMRQTIETVARIQDTLLQMAQVKRFHQAIFDMLRQESPAFAERVVVRLRQLNVQWAG